MRPLNLYRKLAQNAQQITNLNQNAIPPKNDSVFTASLPHQNDPFLLTANLFLVPSPCSAIFVPCVFLRQAAGWQIWTHSAVLPAAAIAQSGELLSHGEFIWPKKGMISWYMGYIIYSNMIHIHTYIYIYMSICLCVVWFIAGVQIYIYICIYIYIEHYIPLYNHIPGLVNFEKKKSPSWNVHFGMAPGDVSAPMVAAFTRITMAVQASKTGWVT